MLVWLLVEACRLSFHHLDVFCFPWESLVGSVGKGNPWPHSYGLCTHGHRAVVRAFRATQPWSGHPRPHSHGLAWNGSCSKVWEKFIQGDGFWSPTWLWIDSGCNTLWQVMDPLKFRFPYLEHQSELRLIELGKKMKTYIIAVLVLTKAKIHHREGKQV